MARNRRSNESAIRLGAVLKVVLACALIVGSSSGYVWQKKQIFELTKSLSEKEKKLQRHREYNKMMAEHLDTLSTPSSIESQIKRLGLSLVRPAESQVVRLFDSSGSVLRPGDPNLPPRGIELSIAR